MTFERGIWAEAIRNAMANFFLLIIIVMLVVALGTFQDIWKLGSVGSIGITFAWLQLAIVAHITILTKQSGIQALSQNKFLGKFFGTSLVFGAGPIIAAILTFFAFKYNTGIAVLSAIFVYSIVEALVFAKWGTRYPAIIVGIDRTFGTAGKRGSQTFGYVLLRLLCCNGPILLVSFVGLMVAISKSNNHGAIWTAAHGLNFNMLMAFSIFDLAFAFQIVLLATILSRAYLIAEDEMKRASA